MSIPTLPATARDNIPLGLLVATDNVSSNLAERDMPTKLRACQYCDDNGRWDKSGAGLGIFPRAIYPVAWGLLQLWLGWQILVFTGTQSQCNFLAPASSLEEVCENGGKWFRISNFTGSWECYRLRHSTAVYCLDAKREHLDLQLLHCAHFSMFTVSFCTVYFSSLAAVAYCIFAQTDGKAALGVLGFGSITMIILEHNIFAQSCLKLDWSGDPAVKTDPAGYCRAVFVINLVLWIGTRASHDINLLFATATAVTATEASTAVSVDAFGCHGVASSTRRNGHEHGRTQFVKVGGHRIHSEQSTSSTQAESFGEVLVVDGTSLDHCANPIH